jgi:hypothetical protein
MIHSHRKFKLCEEEFADQPLRILKEIEGLTFSSALEKYQWKGITPHSDERFSTVLNHITSPSGHTHLHDNEVMKTQQRDSYLLQKYESMEKLRAMDTATTAMPRNKALQKGIYSRNITTTPLSTENNNTS